MLKRERLLTIQNLVEKKGIVTVSEIEQALGVSKMTVRRDLDELADNQTLIRIHGGAQSKHYVKTTELSRLERRDLNVAEKHQIATIITSLIAPGDTVFIGPGTTNELVADALSISDVNIITNSLPVFESFQNHAKRTKIQLIGGHYHARTGAFIGSITVEMLERLRPTKAFISVSGLDGDAVMDENVDEGQALAIALNQAAKRYIVSDHTKLNRTAFYRFYDLSECDALITDSDIPKPDLARYANLTTVLTSPIVRV